jgi:hypothetical protein
MTADVLKGINFMLSEHKTKGIVSLDDNEACVVHLFCNLLRKNRKQLAKVYINDREKGSLKIPPGVKCSILCPVEALETLTAKCAQCGAVQKLKRCSACQAVAYCSKECQTLHWKSGHKKACAEHRAASKTKCCVVDLTKQSKQVQSKFMTNISLRSSRGCCTSDISKKAILPPALLGKSITVKVQTPMFGNNGTCMVYDKKRSFTIHIDDGNCVSGYREMVDKIRADGEMGGLKAYMMAHISSKQNGLLKIEFGRLLPSQPW